MTGPLPHLEPATRVLPLRVTGLRFEAGGRRLLDGVSFTLQPGARVLVLGPNGAGKSLLLRLCHGLLTPSAGSVDWAGHSPEQARQWVAMVFQRPVLLRRSALANLRYALALRGWGWGERRARAWTVLERAGLAHLARQPARVLSGGEQQRLAMARAWALRPQALILDEPSANLDPTATRRVEAMIREIHAAGTTILMTSHDLGQVRRLATEVLFINHGRVVEQRPARDFFEHPASAAAAAYLRGELVL